MHPHLRDDDGFQRDLIEEAKLAARIRHPNVVPVLDAGEDPVGVFLVMDYVEGDTLAGLVRAARAAGTEPAAAASACASCSTRWPGCTRRTSCATQRGRSLGLVHRDFSPQNILVGIDGMARLADFGVAKAATRIAHDARRAWSRASSRTWRRSRRAARPLDRRCDVWAAGVVAWELLAGRRLHPTSDVSTLLEIVSSRRRACARCAPIRARARRGGGRGAALEVRERCPTAARFASRLVDAGAEVASPAEVAAYVTRAVGPRLETRRARVAEVLALRAQMKRITVSASEEAEEANASTGAAGADDAAPPPQAASVQAAPASAPPALALAGEALAEATTDSTSVSAPRELVAAPRRAPARIALAALGGIAIVLGVVAATRSSGGGDTAGAPASVAPGEEPSVAAEAAAQARASESATAATGEPSPGEAPPPASEASPGSASALPGVAPAGAVPAGASAGAVSSACQRPRPGPGGRRLAPSPYGRPR